MNEREHLVAILDDTAAAFELEPTGYALIVAFSRVAGELAPGGALGAKLRAWHDAFCNLKLDAEGARAALAELRALTPKALAKALAAPDKPKPVERFGPDTIRGHCGSTEARETPPGDLQALPTALYGPAYALAWLDGAQAARALLCLPLDVRDPLDRAALRARLEAALDEARQHFPALELAYDELVFTSRLDFVWSFSRALAAAAAGFDTTAKPKRRTRQRAASAAPRPDLGRHEDALLAATTAALERWAAQGQRLAQLFFDGTPPHEDVGICFDSAENLGVTLQAIEARTRAAHARLDYATWATARGELSGRELGERHEPADFSDHMFAQVRLEGFQAFAEAGAPAPRSTAGEPWAAGVMRILFARVLERLVASGALTHVPCATHVYLGYALHDEPAVVLRIVAADED